MTRPSWERYFIDITHLVAKRSTCIRRQVGAILVKDKRVLATGYNGAPSGIAHCQDVGCLREKNKVPSGERHELCRGSHAEQNAIVQAATYGIPIKDAILFCTNLPCSICIKVIINAGIKTIFYEEGYPDNLSEELIREAGITLTKIEKDVK